MSNVYDTAGRVVFSFNARGEVSRSDYNGLGQAVKTTSYATRIAPSTAATVAAVSAAVVANAANDQSVSQVYDAVGRVVFSFNALGEVSKSDYNGLGQRIKLTSYATRIAPATAATVAAVSAAVVANAANDEIVSEVYDAA